MEATRITLALKASYPSLKIDFDLDDRNNILRVQSCSDMPPEAIKEVVSAAGYSIEKLH